MKHLTSAQKAEVDKEVDKQLTQKLQEKISEINKDVLKTARSQANLFKTEFRKQTGAAIIAAFGFVIALAWKDLIIKLVSHVTSTALIVKYPYIADLYTAIIITAFSIVAISIISRWAKNEEKIDISKHIS